MSINFNILSLQHFDHFLKSLQHWHCNIWSIFQNPCNIFLQHYCCKNLDFATFFNVARKIANVAKKNLRVLLGVRQTETVSKTNRITWRGKSVHVILSLFLVLIRPVSADSKVEHRKRNQTIPRGAGAGAGISELGTGTGSLIAGWV